MPIIIRVILLLMLTPHFVSAEDKLLQSTDLTYLGSFTVPKTDMGGPTASENMQYGGSKIAFNPANNSLFITGHNNLQPQLVAEIAIPNTIVHITDAADVDTLTSATVLQNLYDPTDGTWSGIMADGSDLPLSTANRIGGMLVYGGELVGSIYNYYDAGHNAVRSHWKSGSLSLSTVGDALGLIDVGVTADVPQAGHIAGYVAKVPDAWQAIIGAPVISGQGSLSIVSRESSGPAVFGYDPDDFALGVTADAFGLIDYPLTNDHTVLQWDGFPVSDHQNIGGYYSQQTIFKTSSTPAAGAVWPVGSKSILISGTHGQTDGCYGASNTTGFAGGEARTDNVFNTEIIAYMDVNEVEFYPCGDDSVERSYFAGNEHRCCYDPSSTAHGGHAYPYDKVMWVYDADDLVRVKNAGRIVDDPSDNLPMEIIETGIPLRPGVSPTDTKNYEPWDIIPYAMWVLDTPFSIIRRDVQIASTTYDEANQIIYMAEPFTDGVYPTIAVFRVNVSAQATKHPWAISVLGKSAQFSSE